MKHTIFTRRHSVAGKKFSAQFSNTSTWFTTGGEAKFQNVQTMYALYALSMLGLVIATMVFWGYSTYRPILFQYGTGLWIQSHQNVVTILCTALGTLLSALTLYLLNGLLVLMGKLIVTTRGASLSTIEVWNRMFNHDFILDKDRICISILTCIFSFAALYLATAYTTLITPTSVLVTESISGTEIDFSSDAFWGWYNSKDASGNWNRTVTGCQWWTYQNDKGKTTFPTCPYNKDPVSLLCAGVAAAQGGLTAAKPAINYLDKRFESSTGGVLPLGWASFLPFSDVSFDHWADRTAYPSYNYTLSQQGLTAEVSCQATDGTPIEMKMQGQINTTILGIDHGYLNIVNFTWICPSGSRGNSQIIVPHESWATLVLCESPDIAKEYTIFLGAFGFYAEPNPSGSVVFFPNLTCSLKPLLTNAIVKYTIHDGLFRVEHQDKIVNSSYRVPNETIIAVDRIFSLAISNSENMVIDSLQGVVRTNTTVSIASGMEHTLRGYIEYFGTNLRMYYAANEPPGRHVVAGNYTVWRVGYGGEPIVMASLLPPLVLICGLAITYIVLGVRTGVDRIPQFDPIDILSLLAASAAGGNAQELSLPEVKTNAKQQLFLHTSIKYDIANQRLEKLATTATAEDELELMRVQTRTSAIPAGSYDPRDRRNTISGPNSQP